MRKILICVFLLLAVSAFADLNVHIEENRFLDSNMNTILDINYQIPYNQLTFKKNDEGFTANLKINYQILKEENVLLEDSFLQNIIAENTEIAVSPKLFKDKLNLTLSKSGYHIEITFEDIQSGNFFNWEYDFTVLPRESLMSDIEFSQTVYRDTLSNSNLKRGDFYFDIATDHLFNKSISNSFVIYYELQNFFSNPDNTTDIDEIIQLKKEDEIILDLQDKITSANGFVRRIKNINIAELDPGYYTLLLTIKDNLTGFKEIREDFLLIKENHYQTVRMFPELDDEFRLMKYFVSVTKLPDWGNMGKDSKQNLVNQFWITNDPDPITEKNEFYDLVKSRIEYSNAHFSHFDDGWTTDRGRIYVKNGAPDDIVTTRTGTDTKYIEKEVLIWKYRYKQNLTYLFIDLNTSGNHKLIYDENDDEENTYPDWINYLGEEFDQSLLE